MQLSDKFCEPSDRWDTHMDQFYSYFKVGVSLLFCTQNCNDEMIFWIFWDPILCSSFSCRFFCIFVFFLKKKHESLRWVLV